MQAMPEASTPYRSASATVLPGRLDDLAKLNDAALGALYAKGDMPSAMTALDGDLVGRMLRVRNTNVIENPLAKFAANTSFPWGGKSFKATGPDVGTGINRVRLWGLHRVFPFTTFVGKSVLDDRPCVVLDYDHADNPDLIRSIHDEVREVAPGLFLGPACWKWNVPGKKPSLVLWFALDARAGGK